MSLELSEKQFALLMLCIETAIQWSLRQSDEDIDKLIADEELRSQALMKELEK